MTFEDKTATVHIVGLATAVKQWTGRVAQISKSRLATGSSSLEVSGLPPAQNEDILRMFFQNVHRSGGGDVKTIIYRPETNSATVVFHNLDGRLSIEIDRVHGEGASSTCLRCRGPLAYI